MSDYSENYKEVNFNYFCPRCQYQKDEESDPYKKCNDCLSVPARLYSTRPINYRKKER